MEHLCPTHPSRSPSPKTNWQTPARSRRMEEACVKEKPTRSTASLSTPRTQVGAALRAMDGLAVVCFQLAVVVVVVDVVSVVGIGVVVVVAVVVVVVAVAVAVVDVVVVAVAVVDVVVSVVGVVVFVVDVVII